MVMITRLADSKYLFYVLFFINLIVYLNFAIAAQANDRKSLYTFVDGVIVSPQHSAYTNGKKNLLLGLSGFYYCFETKQNSILYLPYDNDKEKDEDALVNLIIDYGFSKYSDIGIIIPYAPDWHPGYGSDRAGIADITIFFKQYLLELYNVDIGMCTFFKLNTSSFKKTPNWYGTDCTNLIVRLIFSSTHKRINFYQNIGFKKVIGSGKRKGYGFEKDYIYSNTIISNFGVIYCYNKYLELSIESNFESPNKRGLTGYYLDICGGLNFNLSKNINLYGKCGKNISNFAPSLYVSTGISVAAKL